MAGDSNWINGGNNAPSNKRRKNRVNIAMKRVPGEIHVEHTNQVIRVRVFLHDISPTGVGLFCEKAIEIGAKVDLVLEVPKHLFLKARVMWCGLASFSNHVITADNFQYRIGLQFFFDSKEAEEEFKIYCAKLHELGR